MPRGKRRSGADEDLRPLLDQATTAFEEGHIAEARSLAEEALAKDPACARARHVRAAALLEEGDVDGAAAEYQRALELSPEDPDILLGYADLLICHPGDDRALVEQGLSLCARGRRLARRQGDKALEFEWRLLEGTALNQIGACRAALEALDAALELSPDSLDAALERAMALFELCRFEDAKKALEQILERSPDEPWAHHYLGLIAERRRDLRLAKRHFARARALAPEDFPPPVVLDDGAFDRAVEDAIARLPEHVKAYLDNTTIAVEPLPADEDLISSDPPLSPTILGVFRGTPVGERSVTNAFDHVTAAIVLYQRNLERFARTREELIEQIGITIMHEVGHLIGLDEHDLWERGLE